MWEDCPGGSISAGQRYTEALPMLVRGLRVGSLIATPPGVHRGHVHCTHHPEHVNIITVPLLAFLSLFSKCQCQSYLLELQACGPCEHVQCCLRHIGVRVPAPLTDPAELSLHGGDVDHKLPGIGRLEKQGLEAGDQDKGRHRVNGERL